MTREPVFVGTAGWSVPADGSVGTQLERYARRLGAVEINSSFYRPHRRETYRRWAGSVPNQFRFAVKMPKVITHEHRLKDCDADIDRFVEEIEGLGEKLGVLLVQLPPSLTFDAAVADAFFTALRRRVGAPLACEPRHKSWFLPVADALLAGRNVARVAADPAPAPGASDPGGWRGLAYLRLHGSPRIYHSDYAETDLAAIADRLAALRQDGFAWCIFDNTALGHAGPNALDIAGRIEAASEP